VPSALANSTTATHDVALATYRGAAPELAEDLVLAAALRRLGVSVAQPIWDDPTVDWSSFRLAIVRSTWDYHRQRAKFLRWVRRTAGKVELWNPPDVLRWNTDKVYLRDLQRAGVPAVPTVWSPRRHPVDLRAAMEEHDWPVVVVKPAVSAAGDRTFRIPRAEARRGQRELARICRTGTAMVQPFLTSAGRGGELSLIFLDGRYSHAVRRIPLFRPPGPRGHERVATASPSMRSVAIRALRACPGPLLYARVDLVRANEGDWRVLEVELTEPSLFFVPYPRGAATLASAISRRLRR
jgi:glutathione synthase/RimK-type ligase-like ATP-grasp enzyme